jgi:drug/metabolite transporter (DMT)-like permease
MSRRGRAARGCGAAVISALFCSVGPCLAVLIYGCGVGPVMLTFIRNAVIVPVLAVPAAAAGELRVRFSAAQLRDVAVLAVLGDVVSMVLMFLSFQMLGSGVASTLSFAYPVFILLIGALCFHQRVRLRVGLCVALCMGGVTLLCLPLGGVTITGVLLALGSACSYAAYAVYMERCGILHQVPMRSMTLWYYLISGVLLLPVTALFGQLRWHIPLRGWLLIAVSSLVAGIGGTVFFQLGVRDAGSRTTSLISTLTPALSLGIGILFLEETPSAANLVGAAMVISSTVILVAWREETSAASAETEEV